jgi:uncharacterized membrane protein YoaK (UPF0700 family)
MLSKPIPVWILLSGFILAAVAGAINAVGFLGVHHQALSHMSGPLTILSNELARGELTFAFNALLVIMSFFGGCVLSALILRGSALKLGRRYGFVLILESVSLFGAWRLLELEKYGGEYLAALACGIQNAMVSSYSGAVIRTTHMTGIVTDLGVALGQYLRGESIDRRRAGLYSVLLLGFFFGGICGSYGYIKIGFNTLLWPALLTGLVGLGYTVSEQFGSDS